MYTVEVHHWETANGPLFRADAFSRGRQTMEADGAVQFLADVRDHTSTDFNVVVGIVLFRYGDAGG